MRLRPLAHCPAWPLVLAFTRGHWTQAYAELFAPPGQTQPTHLHVYDVTVARQAYRQGELRLPSSVVTVSYADDENENVA